MDDTLMTVEELAARAGVTKTRVRQLLAAGVIRGLKRGEGKRGIWEVSERDALRWLVEREQDASRRS